MDPDILDASMGKYKKISLGADITLPSDLLSYPRVAKAAQCTAMQAAHNEFVVPHQLLLNLNACLGKPSGGVRTICKSPMWYRVVCRTDETVTKWELEHTADFDTAGKGKSALIAAAVRNVKAEVYVVFDEVTATFFNEIKKCFDSDPESPDPESPAS